MLCNSQRMIARLPGLLYPYRRVSTLSPLGAAFNRRPEKMTFNFSRANVGLFGIEELVDYTGFYLLQEQAVREAEALVEEATSATRKRKLVQVFDHLSDCLCRVADMADFVRVAHPDHHFATAAEDACMKISALVEKLNTNVDIHRALQNVIDNGDIFETTSIDDRVAKLFMFDFEQSGIHLEEHKRQSFVKINESIQMLGNYFQQGCQQHVHLDRDNLPEDLRNSFSTNGDSVMVTGLFSEHPKDLVREAAYRMYLYPNSQQENLLASLFDQRHALAELVGFPTFAHRALRGTMAETPENVKDFLEKLAEKVRPRAEADFADIKQLKYKYGVGGPVRPWDPPYYSGLARHERCHVESSQLAPYFSLGSCMEGLGALFEALYDVTLQHEHSEYGELWTHDVYKLAVVHRTEGTLGYIYCDFFERPHKPHQDCHFTIRGGRELEDGSYQSPVVVLMLNLAPPRGRIPSLLTPGMMENLFHEFGHAMHSMLGRTKYQHVTGTRCPTDFAEVPSVLMEYFASDPRVLAKFTRHWQTGEPLSEDKIQNLCRAKKMFAASEMQQQVFYSMLDQTYHGKHPLDKSLMDLLADTQNKYYSIPYVGGTAWHLRFGHFVGYGAKYYAYLMSRAVAARIWHKGFREDPFNRTYGERYRHEVLAYGGEKPPAELIKGLLDEQPTTDKLVQSLMDDLDDQQA